MDHYDVFLSHANSDKMEYVDELKKSFDKLGISIFYDKDTLKWGDNWKNKIEEGLNNCEYGVIVISNSFFGREWTEKELKTLLLRQNKCGQKIILPILYNITRKELVEHYKKLSEIQFLDSSKCDIKDITIQLANIMLTEKKHPKSEVDWNNRFDALFARMNTLKFYKWYGRLISGDNKPVKCYSDDYIGWDIGFSDILQSEEDEQTGESMYRINPVCYEEAKDYYIKNIKPLI